MPNGQFWQWTSAAKCIGGLGVIDVTTAHPLSNGAQSNQGPEVSAEGCVWLLLLVLSAAAKPSSRNAVLAPR